MSLHSRAEASTGDAAALEAPVTLATRVRWEVSDALVVTWRNLMRWVRLPRLLVVSTIQPVMFVLLFNYVFGSAIEIPGVDGYIDYLLPGIFAQAVAFGAVQTGVALAEDLEQGVVDRFRSLPMSRSAVLAGRTTADTLRAAFVVLLMTGVGLLIGFRFQTGLWSVLGAFAVIVVFAHALSWVSAVVGLTSKGAETAQATSFVWVFPFVFASSAFVPPAVMPHWLATFATWNPISSAVDAARILMLGQPAVDILGYTPGVALARVAAWTAALLVVFVPFAVSRYRRAAE